MLLVAAGPVAGGITDQLRSVCWADFEKLRPHFSRDGFVSAPLVEFFGGVSPG